MTLGVSPDSSQGRCLRLCWATFPRGAPLCGLAVLASGERLRAVSLSLRYCPISHSAGLYQTFLHLWASDTPSEEGEVVPTLSTPLGRYEEGLSKWKVDLGKRRSRLRWDRRLWVCGLCHLVALHRGWTGPGSGGTVHCCRRKPRWFYSSSRHCFSSCCTPLGFINLYSVIIPDFLAVFCYKKPKTGVLAMGGPENWKDSVILGVGQGKAVGMKKSAPRTRVSIGR